MNKKNFFALSFPLVRECLKTYWYVPAITFVVYFFTGIFPVLSKLSDPDTVEYYLSDSLKNINIIYLALLVIVPVIVAVLMMDFLHNEAKAVMLHSLPLSRNRIFDSYYVGGWVLCQIPVLLMSVSYLLLTVRNDFFSAADVGKWVLSSSSSITFFYGLTVFAGTLTGTTAMNLMAAGVLMVWVPVTVKIVNAYCLYFIAGYNQMSGWVINLAEKSNPLFSRFFSHEPMDSYACLAYFAIGIIISFIARAIYKSRKLELIGTSMLSHVFEEICTYLLVFVGMSVMGMFVSSFGESKVFIVIGMLAGAAVTFFAVKVVVDKSLKVDRSTLKSLAICGLIAGTFMAFTVFDVAGNSYRVPAAEDVESVEIRDMIAGYDYYVMASGDVADKYADLDPVFTSPEAIELVIALHNYILDNDLNELYYSGDVEPAAGVEEAASDGEFGEEESPEPAVLTDVWGEEWIQGNEYVNFCYKLKDGSYLTRSYDIFLDVGAAELIHRIVTCGEYW